MGREHAASHKGCWNYWSLCFWGAASRLHAYRTPNDATTMCQRNFCAAVCDGRVPSHWGVSGCMLPFLAGASSQHGGSTTCMSPIQRVETRAATAHLSHFPLPGSNQASVQAGGSCCGCRDNRGLGHSGRGLCKRESCTSAGGISPQVRVGRRLLAPMKFAWGQVSAPGKNRQLGSRGAIRATS